MCSKTAMLLGQQPTWGRHKAWIRCRNHSLAINNIEMSTTQQPSLPSSQSCSLQAWPLLQMSNITSTGTVYKVVRIRRIRLDMPNQEEEGEVFLRMIQCPPPPPPSVILTCFVQTLRGQMMQRRHWLSCLKNKYQYTDRKVQWLP